MNEVSFAARPISLTRTRNSPPPDLRTPGPPEPETSALDRIPGGDTCYVNDQAKSIHPAEPVIPAARFTAEAGPRRSQRGRTCWPTTAGDGRLWYVPAGEADEPAQTVARLASLRQHQQGGRYPFTRLRADGVWVLDQDVPMDLVGPLTQRRVTGRFEPTVESWLCGEPSLARSAARGLVNSHFPRSVAPDVLLAVGLDPDSVLGAPDVLPDPDIAAAERRRDPKWRTEVLQGVGQAVRVLRVRRPAWRRHHRSRSGACPLVRL